LVAIEAAAVALKLAVVAPEGTVTDAGTESEALLLPRVTTDPPIGAACERVTVHVLTALWPRLLGLQASVDTRSVVRRSIVDV
jgi:hypothetical protein